MEQLVKFIMFLFMGLNLFNFIGILSFSAIHPAQRGVLAIVMLFIGVYFCHTLDRLHRVAYDWSYIIEWWDRVSFHLAVIACAIVVFMFILWASTTRLM